MTSIYRRVDPEPLDGTKQLRLSHLLWAPAPDGRTGPLRLLLPLPPDWRLVQTTSRPPLRSAPAVAVLQAPGGVAVGLSVRGRPSPAAYERTVTRGVLGPSGAHFALLRRERLWGLAPPLHELVVDWPESPSRPPLMALRSSDEAALRQLLPWLAQIRCSPQQRSVRRARRRPGRPG